MMDSEARERGRAWVARARALGFARAGISGLEPSARAEALRAWLDAGKHGSMEYLARNNSIREEPSTLMEGARSAIVVCDQYWSREMDADSPVEGDGRVARYARGRDYHDVMKRKLRALAREIEEAHPGAACRVFVDTAPLPERELAARAGIGWVGKHTLVIEPRLGSWILLGGVMTTLDLEAPREQIEIEDHCGTCTRCIDACPTDAIDEYSVDARRCISYLTIERRGAIDVASHDGIGDWLFGCDVCQEVCPHNSVREEGWDDRHGGAIDERYTARRSGFGLLDVLGWDAEARSEALVTSAMKRATLSMFVRNAAVCAGNVALAGDDAAFRAAIVAALEAFVADERADAMARDAAAASLQRIRGSATDGGGDSPGVER